MNLELVFLQESRCGNGSFEGCEPVFVALSLCVAINEEWCNLVH